MSEKLHLNEYIDANYKELFNKENRESILILAGVGARQKLLY